MSVEIFPLKRKARKPYLKTYKTQGRSYFGCYIRAATEIEENVYMLKIVLGSLLPTHTTEFKAVDTIGNF